MTSWFEQGQGECWESSESFDSPFAAGIVILREAGGFVSDADGKDKMLATGSVVAGNETIQRTLLKLLKTASTTRETVTAADPSP